MYLALTYDHRLLDGREAVQTLVKIKVCPHRPCMGSVAYFLPRNTSKTQQRCCCLRLAFSTASSSERDTSLLMKHEKFRRHGHYWLPVTQTSPVYNDMHSSFSISSRYLLHVRPVRPSEVYYYRRSFLLQRMATVCKLSYVAGCLTQRIENDSAPRACAAPDDELSRHGRVGFILSLTAQ